MTWLSSGLQDIGLGRNSYLLGFRQKPALDNPIVDVGLGLGAAALTGGLALPALGGLFGAADAGAAAGAASTADLASFASRGGRLAGDHGFRRHIGWGWLGQRRSRVRWRCGGYLADAGFPLTLPDALPALGGFGSVTGDVRVLRGGCPGGYAPGGFSLSTGLTSATPVERISRPWIWGSSSGDLAYSGFSGDPTAAASPGAGLRHDKPRWLVSGA